MRRRASSLVLAGALIASGGAIAVAQSAGPADTTPVTPETTASATAEAIPDSGPPGWAQRDRAQQDSQAEKDKGDLGPGRAQGRGPDATGPAAYGLCQAWANQEDPAAKAERVPPFRNLAAAAGGVDKVEGYCAALPERENDGEIEPEDDQED
ncbi:MAG: hypothetical protein LC679_14920 [Intrasporangiaceae bacterium]|nr:hypothetical protein [Intrasporangiaceae bacterium]